MNKFVSVVAIVSILTLQSGCSTFKSGKQKLSVISSEADAEIFVDGNLIGKGAIKTKVPSNKPVIIMAKKEGYATETVYISTTISTSGVLDIIGAVIFIIPIIGIFSAGAYKLQMDSVSLTLNKQCGRQQ